MNVSQLLQHGLLTEQIAVIPAAGLPVAIAVSVAELLENRCVQLLPSSEDRLREGPLDRVRQPFHVRHTVWT